MGPFRKFGLAAALLLVIGLAAGCGVEQANVGNNPLPAGAEETGEPSALAESENGVQTGASGGEPDKEPTGETGGETEDAEPGEAPVESGDDQPAKVADELTARVFEGAYKASKTLDSFAATITAVQEIAHNGERNLIRSDIEMEAVMLPSPVIKSTTRINMEQGEFEMTTIMTDSDFYMLEPTSNTWMKWPVEMADVYNSFGNLEEAYPISTLQEIEPYLDFFAVEETGEGYRLLMETSDESFHALLRDRLEKQGGELEMWQATADVLDNMTIRSLEYEFLLDKSTFHMKSAHVRMDFAMNVDGEEVGMKMDMAIQYDNINGVSGIPLPENAVSIEEMGF